MRSIVSEKEASMAQIYRSAVPFIIMHAFVLIIVMLIPSLALWLPERVF
jgi:TRAP-type mannitol/chloroaromatic compound transport system permease large subunit